MAHFHISIHIYDDLAHITSAQASALDGVTVEKDDVLLNITGASVARCCIVPQNVLPARVNQHVCILRCNALLIHPVFLNQQLISDSYQKLLWNMAEAGGGTRQALTKQQVEGLKLIVPPLERQVSYVKFIQQSDKSKLMINYSGPIVTEIAAQAYDARQNSKKENELIFAHGYHQDVYENKAEAVRRYTNRG